MATRDITVLFYAERMPLPNRVTLPNPPIKWYNLNTKLRHTISDGWGSMPFVEATRRRQALMLRLA